MPEISYFYGIHIRMHYGDHAPPHVHAFYAGDEVLLTFSGEVLDGRLPVRALRLVRKWLDVSRGDLDLAWEAAARYESVGKIAPLP